MMLLAAIWSAQASAKECPLLLSHGSTSLQEGSPQKSTGNFHVQLIDRAGNRGGRAESAVAPDDKRLLESLHKMLDARKKLVRKT